MNHSEHLPIGDPCEKCHRPAAIHRVEHKPVGDPCEKCGLTASHHRVRNADYAARKAAKTLAKDKEIIYVGIDGEGQNDVGIDADGKKTKIPGTHKYTLMCAKTQDGTREWSIARSDGLSTEMCLDFLLSLPMLRIKVFAYAFNYDLTMMLQDINNEQLYKLFRPEIRQNKDPLKPPNAVIWNGYRLNMQGTKFWVRRGNRKRVVWDTFKFYGGPFVQALKEWKVGNTELHEYILNMKKNRSDFDQQSPEAIKKYCMEECQNMGELTFQLVDAHKKMGLKLKNFFGAGSTGDAMLTDMGILPVLRPTHPKMVSAVAQAFFGGRFENSVIGYVPEKCFNYDISSAYPYHIYNLPCLIHGHWSKTKKRDHIIGAKEALIHYRLGKINPRIERSWGPFPYRDDGTICFPIESGGGWVWRNEYVAAERLYKNIEFIEAYVYKSNCKCHPFRKMAFYYRERTLIDKDSGPGIVIKLGINSSYGKLAQSVGRAKFNNWVYAGLITSNTRAQILDMQFLHKEERNMLAVATDGVFTREQLKPPKPMDTGTSDLKKPLGGWEEKIIEKGLFLARPGVYFPCNPTEKELKDVKARGIGKGNVLKHWKAIVDAWEKDGVNAIATVPSVSRFCGAKTSIHRFSGPTKEDPKHPYIYWRADGRDQFGVYHDTAPNYGQWVERRMQLSFDPRPKRAAVNPDGKTLTLCKKPLGRESEPYDKAKADASPEAIEMKRATQEMLEQPGTDYCDLEDFTYEG